MKDRIYLGKVKDDFKNTMIQGEQLYLTKHEWQCDWYWAFGWIGNKNLHTHFDSTLLWNLDATKIFDSPIYNEHDWYVIQELFARAYALKAAAEIYSRGNANITAKSVCGSIRDLALAERINADLEAILNTLWAFMLKQEEL